jgi:Mn2+/Fe2+ NRAMP family transporter
MARLRRLGPGFVYALAVLGTGDLVSNSAAGAGYGYSLIWAVALTLVFRFVWINVSAKYVLVTGESLIQGYARLGRWVIWIILGGVIMNGHMNMMTQIVMSGSAADILFHLPTQWSATIWSFSFTLIAFSMAFWGGYRVVEMFCKILIAIMGVSLIVVAVISKPDPAGILRGALIPTIPGDQGLYSTLFVVMAIIGTGAGSTTNLTYAYFIHEKGWKNLSFLKQQRFDLIFGVVCMFMMGTLLQIAAAATVHPLGIDLEGADDLVRIFSEVQGVVGLVIFSLGLWGAAFSTLVGVTVGYALVVTDIAQLLVPSLKRSFKGDRGRGSMRSHPVYRACVIFYCFSPLYILFTGVRPVLLILLINAMVVLLIPVLTPALLRISNDRSVMGQYKNGWLTNMILIFLVLVAVYLTYENIVNFLKQ